MNDDTNYFLQVEYSFNVASIKISKFNNNKMMCFLILNLKNL